MLNTKIYGDSQPSPLRYLVIAYLHNSYISVLYKTNLQAVC